MVINVPTALHSAATAADPSTVIGLAGLCFIAFIAVLIFARYS